MADIVKTDQGYEAVESGMESQEEFWSRLDRNIAAAGKSDAPKRDEYPSENRFVKPTGQSVSPSNIDYPSETRFVQQQNDKMNTSLKEAYKVPPLADSEHASKLAEGIALPPPPEPAQQTAGVLGSLKNLIPATTTKLATWRQMQTAQSTGVLNPTPVGLVKSGQDWPSENRRG